MRLLYDALWLAIWIVLAIVAMSWFANIPLPQLVAMVNV